MCEVCNRNYPLLDPKIEAKMDEILNPLMEIVAQVAPVLRKDYTGMKFLGPDGKIVDMVDDIPEAERSDAHEQLERMDTFTALIFIAGYIGHRHALDDQMAGLLTTAAPMLLDAGENHGHTVRHYIEGQIKN